MDTERTFEHMQRMNHHGSKFVWAVYDADITFEEACRVLYFRAFMISVVAREELNLFAFHQEELI